MIVILQHKPIRNNLIALSIVLYCTASQVMSSQVRSFLAGLVVIVSALGLESGSESGSGSGLETRSGAVVRERERERESISFDLVLFCSRV